MGAQITLPENFTVLRGQTQKHVNHTILTELINRFEKGASFEALDLPCGNMEFLSYVKALFPAARLCGADIAPPRENPTHIPFKQMDLSADFTLPNLPQFNLVTSVSGVMMFGNTESFVRNCAARLKPGGTYVVTNDNSATIIDKLAYLFLGRHRIFKPVFEDSEGLTQLIPIQELCRLMRKNGIAVERITYTSSYTKDLLYLPFALLVYPFQKFYLRRLKTDLPDGIVRQMYPFKHLFCKHYIITGVKTS